MKTRRDLAVRVQDAIEREEEWVLDFCAEHGHIFGNVAHMRWFARELAQELVATTETWAHLAYTEGFDASSKYKVHGDRA